MKNKYIVLTAACLFLIVAGVCYSYSYKKNHGQEILLSADGMGESDSRTGVKDENKLHIVEDKQFKDYKQPDGIDEEFEESMIYVHICGAVVNPGVYHVEAGTRLVDLINAAGGLSPEAADDYINQAVIAEDGQRIYIPTRDELKELSVDDYLAGDNYGESDENASKKVNINTADETELMSLPGIGQAKAKSIIEYRSKKGSFEAIENLMDISGIKEGLFSQIEDLITVR